ncbi:hypothetical protein QJQ45_021951 [Haematococcus lacustris]|nr:hypothetical protein QJQ45_021951 [Haematococcus lacustris]
MKFAAVVLLITFAAASLSSRDESGNKFSPRAWGHSSICVWLASIVSGGWQRMGPWDRRCAGFGLLTAGLFLHFLHLDPSYQRSSLGRPGTAQLRAQYRKVAGYCVQGWADTFYFCGRELQYCNCNFRWNLMGWYKAYVLWSFMLTWALGVQRIIIQLGLNGLLPGNGRNCTDWLNNWEQQVSSIAGACHSMHKSTCMFIWCLAQWGAECSSMMFELPHFAIELLIILPCVQILCARMKILAMPLVNIAPAGEQDGAVAVQQPAHHLAAAEGGGAADVQQERRGRQNRDRHAAAGRVDVRPQPQLAGFDRADYAPNILNGLWERQPHQRQLLVRLRSNMKVMSFTLALILLAASNALYVPLMLEGTVAMHPSTLPIRAAGEHQDWITDAGVVQVDLMAAAAVPPEQQAAIAQRLHHYKANTQGWVVLPQLWPLLPVHMRIDPEYHSNAAKEISSSQSEHAEWDFLVPKPAQESAASDSVPQYGASDGDERQGELRPLVHLHKAGHAAAEVDAAEATTGCERALPAPQATVNESGATMQAPGRSERQPQECPAEYTLEASAPVQQLPGSRPQAEAAASSSGADGSGCTRSLGPYRRNLHKHMEEIIKMQDPEHIALIPLVESALAVMRLSCEKFFVLLAVYVAHLLYQEQPSQGMRTFIRVIAGMSTTFQRVSPTSFQQQHLRPLSSLYHLVRNSISQAAAEVCQCGGAMLPCQVMVRSLRPATVEEVQRMAGNCAICWGKMTVPGSTAPAAHPPACLHPVRDQTQAAASRRGNATAGGTAGEGAAREVAGMLLAAQPTTQPGQAQPPAGQHCVRPASAQGPGPARQVPVCLQPTASLQPSCTESRQHPQHLHPFAQQGQRETEEGAGAAQLPDKQPAGPSSADSALSLPCNSQQRRKVQPHRHPRRAASASLPAPNDPACRAAAPGSLSTQPDLQATSEEGPTIATGLRASSTGLQDSCQTLLTVTALTSPPAQPSSVEAHAPTGAALAVTGLDKPESGTWDASPTLAAPVLATVTPSVCSCELNTLPAAAACASTPSVPLQPLPSLAATNSAGLGSPGGGCSSEAPGTSSAASLPCPTPASESSSDGEEDEEGLSGPAAHGWSLPCGHAYHSSCLGQWLFQCHSNSISPTCPMCQATIRLDVSWRLPWSSPSHSLLIPQHQLGHATAAQGMQIGPQPAAVRQRQGPAGAGIQGRVLHPAPAAGEERGPRLGRGHQEQGMGLGEGGPARVGAMRRQRGRAHMAAGDADAAGGGGGPAMVLLPPPMAALEGVQLLGLLEYQREIQELLLDMPQIPVPEDLLALQEQAARDVPEPPAVQQPEAVALLPVQLQPQPNPRQPEQRGDQAPLAAGSLAAPPQAPGTQAQPQSPAQLVPQVRPQSSQAARAVDAPFQQAAQAVGSSSDLAPSMAAGHAFRGDRDHGVAALAAEAASARALLVDELDMHIQRLAALTDSRQRLERQQAALLALEQQLSQQLEAVEAAAAAAGVAAQAARALSQQTDGSSTAVPVAPLQASLSHAEPLVINRGPAVVAGREAPGPTSAPEAKGVASSSCDTTTKDVPTQQGSGSGAASSAPESQMEPGGPLPPQPPELTARYNKKLLTLEEISQAHASSVYAQKYSIEVVGGKIKAVCNDCKVVLSCGNLSDSRKHQCNKRPRSDQHAIAGGTSVQAANHLITSCCMLGCHHSAATHSTVAMGVSDGYKNKYAQLGASLMDFSSLQGRPPRLPPSGSSPIWLLGVHATSAASERNWSAWGRLFTSARTRLTLERAKMLIYIKANAGLGARRSNEAQLLARMGE